MARIVRLIENYTQRGTGSKVDPFRNVYQLFSLDGELVYERDIFQDDLKGGCDN